MIVPTPSTNIANGDRAESSALHDREIWQNLQQAISQSSGFKSWQKENQLETTVEEQVKQYLRSTLETLAY